MSLANHSQQSINLKQCYFEDYLMNDKTIKKALSKQIQDIQKIQPIQNQFIQNASENNKQLQMLKQKLGFKQGDLKNNENTIKKSQRKQIQKSPQNSIYSQSEQQNVLNDHVEKSLGYKQIKYEKNISAKGIQGQLILDEDTKKNMLKSKDKKFQVNQHDSIQFTSNNNVQVCDSQIEIKFIKLEWSILIFQQLNVNSYLSDNFKSKEEQIFNKLQEKGYFLLNKVNQNQNQEVFEGYQQIEQTTIIGICKQYYFAVLHDFSEEDFSLKIERACSISLNGLPLLIDYFIINQNTKIIIFQKQNYSDLDDQVIDFLIKDFKLWSYQLFDFLNSGLKNHFITDDDQNLLKSFKLHQETIINNLLQKNYYLTRYINKGGQGIIFDGFREDSSSNYYNYFDEIKIALQYYLDSLEENKQFYKENNISIANTLFEIGKCYYNQQDFKNSLKYFLEYRDMRQQLNYILYDDDYFLSLSYIVKCYQFINDPFNAQNISLENYQTSINMNREEDEIQDSLNLFVKNCYNSETYQQALDLRVQNLKYEKFYQENLLRIGGLYELIGKFDLSIQYYEKLYIQSNLDNEIKCQCILRLGQGYKILEFYEIALMYLLELYDMIKNVKSPEDQIEMILNDIIFCSQKCDNLEQSQVYMQKLKKVKDCNYNPERTQVLKLTQYF
ncbi:hypothetical protein ABPG74_019184 [Tetrahymena malaccensis]